MSKIMHFSQNSFCVDWYGMKFVELTEHALIRFSKYMDVAFWMAKVNEISYQKTRYIIVTTDINDYQIEFIVVTKITNKNIKKMHDIIKLSNKISSNAPRSIKIHGLDIYGKKMTMTAMLDNC